MGSDLKYTRILNLYNQFCSGKVVHKEKEAFRYGVTERSVQRDIDALRDYFSDTLVVEGEGKKEIIYDRKENGYRLIDESNKILNERDVFVLIKILLASKGLAKGEMQVLINKILSLCADGEKYQVVKALISNEMLNYKGPMHEKELFDKIWLIADAVCQQRRLTFDYKRLKGHQVVHRQVEPIGILFSEYYFYMLAHIKWDDGDKSGAGETIYRIDRMFNEEISEEHFSVTYANKFSEADFRERTPFMMGGDFKQLKFWYKGPSLEAILDKIPTAKIVEEVDGKFLLTAKVVGDGAEMWLRGQGEMIEIVL